MEALFLSLSLISKHTLSMILPVAFRCITFSHTCEPLRTIDTFVNVCPDVLIVTLLHFFSFAKELLII